VKSTIFSKCERTAERERALGPGEYNIANNSPGKYVESKNRNNMGYRFSKSPCKGFENNAIGRNLGPGVYQEFSEFGNNV
jgi:hypothetical protein